MLNFKPMTEDEILYLNLLPAAEYAFRVKHAENKLTQDGKPMIKMIVGVVDKDGRERNIYDNLMATDTWLFKLRHFCHAVGLEAQYQQGTLKAEDCLNRTGACKVGIKKDKDGQFPPQNNILDYVKAEHVTIPQGAKPQDKFNDDIPF